jgi:hypothetical protein
MKTIGKHSINIGNEVFHGFEKGKVAEMEGDRVRSVRFPYGTVSSWDLHVMPVTEETEKISKIFSDIKEEIRRRSGNMNLNWPAISTYMNNVWFSICLETIAPTGDSSKDILKALRKEFRKFSNNILKTIDKLNKMEVCDVKLFR